MTRRAPLPMTFGLLLVIALASCGGSPPKPVQQQAAGSTRTNGGETPSSGGGEASPTQGGGDARPGAPGPDPGAGGGGGSGGGGGGGRPAGPFDVEAFENRGQDLAGFREFANGHCSGGRCVLVEQTSEDPDARPGCEVADFAYDPPARPPGAPPADQFIQRGTTVTVFVHCPPATSGSTAGGSSAGESSAGESSGDAASSSSGPPSGGSGG